MSFTPYLETSFSVGSLTQRFSVCVLHFLAGSFFYDGIHWLAHHPQRSRFRILRLLAKAHAIHHQYFDRSLRYNERFRSQNLTWHLTLELLCQMVGSTLSCPDRRGGLELRPRFQPCSLPATSKGPLHNTDVLVLAHGSKNGQHDLEANCASAVAIIDIFRESCGRRKLGLLPEVWYVGSEAELHGAWTSDMQTYTGSKRAFVRHARAFYDEETFNYRHIVPAAFASGMGTGLVSPRWAARVALWWIRRGARYVPVTYTGLAFVNYLRFRLGRRLADQPGHKPQRSTSPTSSGGSESGGRPSLSLESL
ncbi:hypothetical protein CTA2_12115 [Colletotrichum tanaceti]|uniref:Fatty acid hydroxylase domain-containing protein n=1 Tax=Colletotrichum tanaceti TaxID=1306861 RepID=A0A4U6XCF3_9PEZI|nr:hypothetical protein CTA2_12115 [Colletotrichum tanaceti]TKW53421.1 hypothetical protein CTA1_8833 [Colletotrichum tanaceti]